MAGLSQDGSWDLPDHQKQLLLSPGGPIRFFFQTLSKLLRLPLTCTCQTVLLFLHREATSWVINLRGCMNIYDEKRKRERKKEGGRRNIRRKKKERIHEKRMTGLWVRPILAECSRKILTAHFLIQLSLSCQWPEFWCLCRKLRPIQEMTSLFIQMSKQSALMRQRVMEVRERKSKRDNPAQ